VPTRLLAVLITLAAVAGAALAWVLVVDRGGSTTAAPSPTPTVLTSLPGLPTPTGEPELTGLATASPAPGTAIRVAGPFDDRFSVGRVRFDGAALTGTLTVTSDVSYVMELQVLAGFYDRQGTLLGEGRFVHHFQESQESEKPQESWVFRIAVPADLRGEAVSVAYGVPVLVNE
jgi:hypothetical protein